MKKHQHGGRVFAAARELDRPWREIVDFSANINPLGQPKGLAKALFRDFDLSLHYPELKAESLAEVIGETVGLPLDMVLPGSGSSPQLYLLARTLEFERPFIIGPAFAEYEMALLTAGRKPEYVLTREADDWLITEKTIEGLLDKKPDAIFLANPANPTSRLVPAERLEELVREAGRRKVWLIVDEAFIDFTGGVSVLPFLGRQPRLVVLRSLTKIFALPGLRLAWLGADRTLAGKLRDKTEPWPLSSLAISAGLHCLAQKDWAEKTREALKPLRRKLTTLMSRFGRVYPSESNYILMKLNSEYDPDVFIKHLYERGVLVRDASNFQGLSKGYLRLALRPVKEINVLAKALEEI